MAFPLVLFDHDNLPPGTGSNDSVKRDRESACGISSQELDGAETDRKVTGFLKEKLPSLFKVFGNKGRAVGSLIIALADRAGSGDLAQRVQEDLKEISNSYQSGQMSGQQFVRRVSDTLLEERIPLDLRMQYLPLVMQTTSDQISKLQEAQKCYQNLSPGNDWQERRGDRSRIAKLEAQQQSLEKSQEELRELQKSKSGSQNPEGEMQRLRTSLEEVQEALVEVQEESREREKVSRSIPLLVEESMRPVHECNEQLLAFLRGEENRREMENFDRDFQRMEDSVGNAVEILGVFGDPKLAQQVKVVSGAALKIGKELSGLMGAGTLALSTGPVGACLAIGAAVASVVQAFASTGPSEGEVILEQIRALARQIAQLQEYMGQRFDQLDKKVDKLLNICAEGLQAIEANQHDLRDKCDAILEIVQDLRVKVFFDNEATRKQIEKLHSLVARSQKASANQELTSLLYDLLNEEHPDPSQYRDKMGKLLDFALHQSKRLPFLGMDSPSSPLLEEWDYSLDQVPEILNVPLDETLPNPNTYSLGALGAIFLILQQFPDVENLDRLSQISRADLDRLLRIKQQGETLLEGLRRLSNGSNPKSLIEDQRACATALGKKLEALEAKFKEEEKRKYNALAREIQFAAYDSSAMRETFRRDFPICIRPSGSSFFKGIKWTEHHKRGFATWYDNRHGHLSRAENQYKTAVKKSIHVSREDSLKKYDQAKKPHYQNEIDPLQKIEELESMDLKDILFPFVIHPQRGHADYPLLPAPAGLHRCIPKPYLLASSKGLGVFRYEYETGVNDLNKNFSIEIFWIPKSGAEPHRLAKVSIKNPNGSKIHTGAERAWWDWMGGTFCKDGRTQEINYYTWYYSDFPNEVKHYCQYPILQAQEGLFHQLQNAGPDGIQVDFSEDTGSRSQLSTSPFQKILEELRQERGRQKQRYFEFIISALSEEDLGARLQPELGAWEQAMKRVLAYHAVSHRDDMGNPGSPCHRVLFSGSRYYHFSAKDLAKFFRESSQQSFRQPEEVRKSATFLLELMRESSLWERGHEGFQEPLLLRCIVDTIEKLQQIYGPSAVDCNRWNATKRTVEFKDQVLQASFGVIAELLTKATQSDSIDSRTVLETFQNMGNQMRDAAQNLSSGEQTYSRDFFDLMMKEQLRRIKDSE